ncbi:hypothetical protein QJS10_CPB22g01042 [Acorus calamus]|uniref:Uncharacterized protein n=1 Tax=Acorus calamus TaxID=4465 RepID=A0AAV9BYU1_ACOCL|nr:hypothetical protein QJS10_CPB22g01042 [Acorus calamus]
MRVQPTQTLVLIDRRLIPSLRLDSPLTQRERTDVVGLIPHQLLVRLGELRLQFIEAIDNHTV